MHQSPFYGIFPDTMKYIFKEILKKFLLTTRTFFFHTIAGYKIKFPQTVN